MRSPLSVEGLPWRDRVVILTCIVLITALAWAYLIHLDREMSSATDYEKMMAEMGMAIDRPWTATDLLVTFAMWAVMMLGMMAASAAPMLLLFGAAHSKRGERGASLAVLIFGLGYLIVWMAFSICATLAQWVLQGTMSSSLAMVASSPRFSAVILIAAGIYQLTPLKLSCLKHCRTPLGFIMTNWREGKLGGLWMGIHHGAYCLGCCWALMCVLFVVGVMNLFWVAALSAFVLIEKTGPWGPTVARASGVGMILVGAFLMVA